MQRDNCRKMVSISISELGITVHVINLTGVAAVLHLIIGFAQCIMPAQRSSIPYWTMLPGMCYVPA